MIEGIVSLLIVGLIIYFVFLKKQGNLDFWKAIGKNPDEAYKCFKENPQTWKVIDSNSSEFAHEQLLKNSKYRDTWVGPFRLWVPSINKMVKIYGEKDRYIQEQELILKNIHLRTLKL